MVEFIFQTPQGLSIICGFLWTGLLLYFTYKGDKEERIKNDEVIHKYVYYLKKLKIIFIMHERKNGQILKAILWLQVILYINFFFFIISLITAIITQLDTAWIIMTIFGFMPVAVFISFFPIGIMYNKMFKKKKKELWHKKNQEENRAEEITTTDTEEIVSFTTDTATANSSTTTTDITTEDTTTDPIDDNH